MQQIFAYGKYYEIDDSVNMYSFLNEKRKEREKNRAFEELRKENERLKDELKEKEAQLALKENWEAMPPNGSIDISPKVLEGIMEEGKNFSSQLALEGLRKASAKGFKFKWRIK
jgi:hypothetical protein